MTDLPTGTLYGTVVGQFIQAVADTADAGRDPDSLPMQGTVTFTPGAPRVLLPTASPNPLTMYQKSITCTLDSSGYLLGPDGVRGVKLVASDSPGNPTNFTYSVSVDLVGTSGFAFNFLLPAGATVDLTTVIPASGSSGDLVPTDKLVAEIVTNATSETRGAIGLQVGRHEIVTGSEKTLDRIMVDTSSKIAGLRLTYFTASSTRVANGVLVMGDGVASGMTLCRFGLYSEDSSGNLTLIASTPNNTTLFATNPKVEQVAFSAGVTITAGSRYAVGHVAVATTKPYLVARYVYAAAAELGPRLVTSVPASTDLNPTIPAASLDVSATSNMLYAEVW